jgi:hypothetical protein
MHPRTTRQRNPRPTCQADGVTARRKQRPSCRLNCRNRQRLPFPPDRDGLARWLPRVLPEQRPRLERALLRRVRRRLWEAFLPTPHRLWGLERTRPACVVRCPSPWDSRKTRQRRASPHGQQRLGTGLRSDVLCLMHGATAQTYPSASRLSALNYHNVNWLGVVIVDVLKSGSVSSS